MLADFVSFWIWVVPQVVQQQQQLQMSFAWSFLHVGQSMTANLFHSTSAVSGPKAARRLSERIVGWAMCSCIVLACGTFTFRSVRKQNHLESHGERLSDGAHVAPHSVAVPGLAVHAACL
jgi:hypothetical protein